MLKLDKSPKASIQAALYFSMEKHIVWISALSLYAGIANAQSMCKGKDDPPGVIQSVDWAIFYVIPNQANANAIYSSQTPVWENNKVNLTIKEGALGGLFVEYYNNNTKKQWNMIAYSNFPPSHRDVIKYASPVRGVFGYNGNNGWWLSHSIDKWPDMQATEFAFPPARGAGLIVCVTVPVSEMGRWGTALNYQNPMIYYFQSATAGNGTPLKNIEELNELTEPPRFVFSPYVRKEEFQTPNGLKYSVLSMLPQARQDFYSSYMAIALRKKLIVYSKPAQYEPLMPSKCAATYTVENVKAKNITVNGVPITRSYDSSRWAISKANNANAVFCISSNDRRRSVIHNGGGALCLHDQNVHQLFRALVSNKDIEACKTT
uniref:Deoxyribonuclease II n=1 Tax=Trichuris muris TaxID=70415 RepID=A0A5S6Q9M5_TRIMR